MLKVEKITVEGWEPAIRGMRNPLNSWDKSDSEGGEIGDADLSLMGRLYRAGTEHRKYLRMIVIWMDITAPLYWWKEYDTYKIGTVTNSCSTMHKIHSREFTIDDFSHDHMDDSAVLLLHDIMQVLNRNRTMFLKTKDKRYWWNMIQLLPSSYNQKRTIMLNYEVAVRIIGQRSGHKLSEWHTLVDVLRRLPNMQEIM